MTDCWFFEENIYICIYIYMLIELQWLENPQNAEPKLYHWATGPYRTLAMPNWLLMINAWPHNLMCLEGTFYPYRGHSHLQGHVALRIHVGITSWAGNRFYIWIEELYYVNWITMTRKSGKHFHATYGTLDSCFDLIRSHQQCIPWSPPLKIEPQNAELKLYHWATVPYRTQAMPN